MPRFNQSQPTYKPTRDVSFSWDTFRKGLNTLLRENEIGKDELAQAENVLLIGKGIPTKRWGIALMHQAGATGAVRGLKGFYPSGASGSNELIALTDEGYLTNRSNASYSPLTGASWASGYNAEMVQLDNRLYVVNGQRELVRYSSPTLVGFPTIGIPGSLGASNLSGATGATTKSYRVSAVSNVGETLASTSISLTTQPETLGGTFGGTIRVNWAAVSTASGVLQGYNVYGRDQGEERFLGSVDASSTVFLDTGAAIPKDFTYPPSADSTGGPKCRFIERFQDRLVFAGFAESPTKVLISGRVPFHERFDIASGGNFVLIEPDGGDPITGIKTFRDRIVVFKERSIWQVTLTQEQVGNFFVTTPSLQLITNSNGCIAPRSIVAVEGDVYFLSRSGVRSLGYEQGFAFDVLRSSEISVKIRPFFKNLAISQLSGAVAVYHDFKYVVTFPGLEKTMVFDRERGAWVGPWTFDANVFEVYYDSTNNAHLLFGNDTTPLVDELSSSYGDDKGTAINTILRTRQEDFGDWTLFKNVKEIFVQFRGITGSVSVDVQLETRNGTAITAKAFEVNPNTGVSGWGADLWGSTLWGNSASAGGGLDTAQTIRWATLNRAARTMQLILRTTDRLDNFELLGIRGNAKPIGAGFRPSSWRI